jgi:hypothetical protein
MDTKQLAPVPSLTATHISAKAGSLHKNQQEISILFTHFSEHK